MEVTVKDYIYVRVGKASLNAPAYQYLAPGSKLIVDGKLYKGDAYDGIDTWLKDAADNYYWSGGIQLKKPSAPLPQQPKYPPAPVNYWQAIHALGVPQNKGGGISVAVLDSGIEDHADLKNIQAFDCTGGNAPSDRSPVGHGTHVAGIIGASPGNANGITGVSPGCGLLSFKVSPATAPTTCKYINTALRQLMQEGVRLVNMSFTIHETRWKNDPHHRESEDLMKEAVEKGIILIAASGVNKELEMMQYPACLDSCISVGGFSGLYKPVAGKTKYKINFISYAHEYWSCSTQSNSYYIALRGASMNTAFITGIAARLVNQMQHNGTDINKNTVVAELEKYDVPTGALNAHQKDYKFSTFHP